VLLPCKPVLDRQRLQIVVVFDHEYGSLHQRTTRNAGALAVYRAKPASCPAVAAGARVHRDLVCVVGWHGVLRWRVGSARTLFWQVPGSRTRWYVVPRPPVVRDLDSRRIVPTGLG
jgi:hypothetical protein